MKRLRATFRLRGFRPIATAYTVNELGDWFGEIALAVLVYDQTGSPLATAGLFLGMQFLPSLLSQGVVVRGEMAGIKRALVALYAMESGVFLVLALGANSFPLILIVALAAVDGTLATANRALTRSAAGSILKPAGLLREGNSVINVSYTTASVIAPVLAGLSVAGLGIRTTLLVDAVSFLLVAIILLRVTGIDTAPKKSTRWSTFLREGLRYARSRQVLWRLILANGAAWLFISVATPVEIIYVRESLSAGNTAYGILLVAWGAGMFAGSIAFAAARQTQLRILIVFGAAAVGISYLGMASAPTLALACGAAAVGGIGNGVLWVATVSAVQSLASSAYQARTLGLLEATSSAVPGIGFLLGGAVTAAFSPRIALAAAGVCILVVLAVATMMLRKLTWREDSFDLSVADHLDPSSLTA